MNPKRVKKAKKLSSTEYLVSRNAFYNASFFPPKYSLLIYAYIILLYSVQAF